MVELFQTLYFNHENIKLYRFYVTLNYSKNQYFVLIIVAVASEETAFLLGTCYYRARRLNEAHYLLQNIPLTLPQARFLLAKCCVDLKL